MYHVFARVTQNVIHGKRERTSHGIFYGNKPVLTQNAPLIMGAKKMASLESMLFYSYVGIDETGNTFEKRGQGMVFWVKGDSDPTITRL
jgi:hypothetical protein